MNSNKFDFHRLQTLITFPVMQLTYLDLFELCYTDLIKAVCLSTEKKQNKLNGPVGQLSVWPRCCSVRRINKELYTK